MVTPLFDLGIAHVRIIPDYGPSRVWAWSIRFRDLPQRVFHIVRRTGALREWK
jgi:hypothetical protein